MTLPTKVRLNILKVWNYSDHEMCLKMNKKGKHIAAERVSNELSIDLELILCS